VLKNALRSFSVDNLRAAVQQADWCDPGTQSHQTAAAVTAAPLRHRHSVPAIRLRERGTERITT